MRIARQSFTIVAVANVLPHPGPPVSTMTGAVAAVRMAARWPSDSFTPDVQYDYNISIHVCAGSSMYLLHSCHPMRTCCFLVGRHPALDAFCAREGCCTRRLMYRLCSESGQHGRYRGLCTVHLWCVTARLTVPYDGCCRRRHADWPTGLLLFACVYDW